MQYDILIVGYGPVSATLANLLGRAGLTVGIVESAPAIYDKPRAVSLDHEALRTFQWCGLGEEIFATTAPHAGTNFVGVDGGIIKRYYPMEPPYLLGWVPNVSFVQPELEAILRRGVARYPSVEVHMPATATAIRESANGVELDLQAADGSQRTLSARYLVGCDGASSFVRRRMGATVEDLDFDEWWVVVDGWIDPDLEVPDRSVQYCRPSRPGTYVLCPRNVRRWEIKLLPGERAEDFASEGRIREVLREFVDDSKLKLWRSATYRFHALVVNDWQAGRLFLAGDAAHQTPPFMGQGLCAGLRDVANLWWKLVDVVQGRAPASLLATYTPERRPHVREVIGMTKEFGLIIGELDRERALERDRRLREELETGRAITVRQRFIPGLVDGLLARDATGRVAAGAGQLFAQPEVIDDEGRARRLDDVVGPRWIVTVTNPAMLAELDAATRATLARIGGSAVAIVPGGVKQAVPDVLAETGTIFAGWCRKEGAVAAIARPDRYAYAFARSASELNALVAQLARSLAPM